MVTKSRKEFVGIEFQFLFSESVQTGFSNYLGISIPTEVHACKIVLPARTLTFLLLISISILGTSVEKLRTEVDSL